MKCCKKVTDAHSDAVNKYPGAAVDTADKDRVSEKEIKQRTRTLNNNPRNEGNPV